jgi:cytochrome c biogenesis protein CcmG/thiol:disulfide interchange protein DsbE
MDTTGEERREAGGLRRALPFLVPLAIFALVAVFLALGLGLDPRRVPSPLVGKPVPEFSLPPLKGRTEGLSSRDLKNGEVSLLNVFASWCVPCRDEHPLLMELHRRAIVPIHGINYKDDPDAAARWLAELGDPYARAGADLDGRAGIEWGVYGVPETFVIDREGRIAYKHIGPISPEAMQERILPLVRKLQAAR